METSHGASDHRVGRRREFQSRLRALRLVAAGGGGACGTVRADPRTAPAPRRLDGRLIRFRALRLRHLLALHLPARVWPGAGVADTAAADSLGCSDVSLCGGRVLRLEPFLAQARRDTRLAGVAGAVGAARVAARLAAVRLPVAVHRLRDDRLAVGRLGAAARRVWRDLGRGVDSRRSQRRVHAGGAGTAALRGAWCCRVIVCGSRVAVARAVDPSVGAARRDRRRARSGAARSEVAGEKSRIDHAALSEAHRRGVGCPPHRLAGGLVAGPVDRNSRLLASTRGAGARTRR